ncbi:MAG TPA: cellobiose phosphorylase, partial [Methylocella sp.]|nr:cellobiose phosphorylase [Methylocella sp.]
MTSHKRSWTVPSDEDLGLLKIENDSGLSISVLPNGCIFAIEYRREGRVLMINQLLGSPIGGGIGRIYLRCAGNPPACFEIMGPRASVSFSANTDSFLWEGETRGLRHYVTLALHPEEAAWIWRVDAAYEGGKTVSADAILIQDIGLGSRNFLMNNEAYASQYIDHHIAHHSHYGPVIMCRQNLDQEGRNPWLLHACLDGAAGFATDGLQLFGPRFRGVDAFGFPSGTSLPSIRLQHELACAGLQSRPAVLGREAQAKFRFMGLFVDDHPGASTGSDLARLDAIRWVHTSGSKLRRIPLARSVVQDAAPAEAQPISMSGLSRLYPERMHEEWADGTLLSFFIPDLPHNRHIILGAKEGAVTRRHGTLLRSGQAMLPDDATLCATCWMQGIFAAQLTIGNTSFHKLFSVSREPYNITRAGGLRILVDAGGGWQLLAVPSVFEIGLADCRWLYFLKESSVTVRAIASGTDPAMQWQIKVEGAPCRFLVYASLAGGEREFDGGARIEIDSGAKRLS